MLRSFTFTHPVRQFARFLVVFLIFTNISVPLVAQCSDVTLGTLQNLQKADPTTKESKILEAGFDLRNAVTKQGATSKIYSRCWLTSVKQQTYYDQKLIWNLTDDSVKFATLNEPTFRSLRKELDERHPAGAGSTVVRGKMFTYYVGIEKIDGIDYYTLMINGR